MKIPLSALPLTLAMVAAVGSWSTAQIERLDLTTMVAKTDNCVLGTIVNKTVVRIDHPVDGPELYYTTLTIEGRSLNTNRAITVDVKFPGGFIDETHGVRNSEAPADEEVKVGNTVVAFYKWLDNMGGDVSGNALYASHGGLYTTFERLDKGVFVQGRGNGYAIPTNLRAADLEQQVAALAAQKK